MVTFFNLVGIVALIAGLAALVFGGAIVEVTGSGLITASSVFLVGAELLYELRQQRNLAQKFFGEAEQ